MIRFFPNDPETVFYARAELACLKFDAKKYDAALAAFQELLTRKPDGVGAEYVGYARFFEALTLKELGKEDEALAGMKTLAGDEGVSEYRRSWAARWVGDWLAKHKPVPAEAITFLKQATAEEECRPISLSLLIPAMAAGGQGDALVSGLVDGSLFEGLDDDGAEVMTEVTRVAKTGDKAASTGLLEWLRKARDAMGEKPAAKPVSAACIALENWATRGDTLGSLRKEVLVVLERKRPDDLKSKAIEACGTAAAGLARMEELNATDSQAVVAMGGGLFRKFEASDALPRALWLYLSHLKVVEHDSGVAEESAAFPELVEIAGKLPHDDKHYWECLFLKANWLKEHGKYDEVLGMFRAMPEDPQFNVLFEKPVWNRMGETYEAQGKWKEAIECYVKFKDERREFQSVAEHLLRAGLLMARSGDREEALDLWKLLSDVPPAIYESSGLAGEIQDAIALAENPKLTLQQWSATETWWKHTFIPYVRSLKGDMPIRPPLFYSTQADDLNLRCRKAVAEKDLKPILEDLASVAFTSRWLPSQAQSVRIMMDTYVKSLAASSAPASRVCFQELAGTVRTGAPLAVELCKRFDAALSFDGGKPERTLQVIDGQWEEAPGRSEEHRARSAWLFAAASAATGKKVDVALEVSTYWMDHSEGFLTIAQWAPTHADLLVRSGKRAEAVAFLKGKASRSGVKGNAALVTPILEKISQLEDQGESKETLASAVEAVLKKHKPAWYDHVGPKALDDPRVGDPAKVSDPDLARFHPAERFRLRMLVAQSPDVEMNIRERALTAAMLDLGKQQTTWNQAVGVWREVLDQEKVSTSCRLQMLWKFSLELASAGQVEALAELRKSPVFATYSTAYAERYFPMVEKIAKGRRDGPQAFKEAIAQLGERELDGEDLVLAGLCHTGLLDAGDTDGAAAAREALKTWKLSPALINERNPTRLSWMRKANMCKQSLAFHEAMLARFGDRLTSLARQAPAGWEQRIDVVTMGDLKEADRHAIDAARLTQGKRMERTTVKDWILARSTWLNAAGPLKPTEIAEACKLMAPLEEIEQSAALGTVLFSMDPMQDQDQDTLAGELKLFKDPTARPAAEAVVSFWQAIREYRPGRPLELDKCLERVSRVPVFFRVSMRASLLERTWANGNIRQVEQTLDSFKADEEMDANAFEVYLPVLQDMKRQEELEIANEDAVKLIRDEMMTAWCDLHSPAFHRACDLALLCNRKELLPAAWLDTVPGLLAMDYERSMARARTAQLRGDWKAMKVELDAAKDIPASEKPHHAWFMACALDGLGDKAKAIESARDCIHAGNVGNRYFVAAARYLHQAGVELPKAGQ
ncbi:MAG: tetratricopeptide repeat protein [Luteolibacter sp.]